MQPPVSTTTRSVLLLRDQVKLSAHILLVKYLESVVHGLVQLLPLHLGLQLMESAPLLTAFYSGLGIQASRQFAARLGVAVLVQALEDTGHICTFPSLEQRIGLRLDDLQARLRELGSQRLREKGKEERKSPAKGKEKEKGKFKHEDEDTQRLVLTDQ